MKLKGGCLMNKKDLPQSFTIKVFSSKVTNMKKVFLFIILALIMIAQACFTTKHTPASNNQLGATPMEQMYPGHTMLKPDEVPQAARDAWNSEHSQVSGEEWYKEDSAYVVYY